MENSSGLNFYYIEFTVFTDFGPLRYLFFSLCLLVYMIIISANLAIILTVCLDKSLHQPMYVFICCLCCNSLFGSTGFFPRFLFDLLSDTHLISRPSCFVQMFVIFSHSSHELPILTVMAYDRFVAICQPLHYHSKMTLKTTVCIILFAELYPAIVVAVVVLLLVALPLCRTKLNRLHCSKLAVLTCVDTSANRIAVQIVTMTTVVIPLCLILYTYLQILIVCRRHSAEFKRKALQTCLPHIVTFLNFSLSFFVELMISRLKQEEIHPAIVVVLTLESLGVPPLSNPLVYGLSLPQIRGAIYRRFNIKIKFFFLLHYKKRKELAG